MSGVKHDISAHRFTTEVDGERALLDYTLTGTVMTITHTLVPKPIEGRGIAALLMSEAMQTARQKGWKVLPQCSYAVAYLAKNAKQHESDLLDEALDESFPASDSPAVGGSN